jgi:parallel beta-helix repeat protein
VTSTGDGGAGTLRQAIIDANASPGSNNVVFDIPPPAGGQPIVIPLMSALPALTNPVNILGNTEPGFAANPMPLITIDGTNAGAGVDGLTLSTGSDQSQVTDLTIANFSGNGVVINSGNRDYLADLVVDHNGGNGILIEGSSSSNLLRNNFIGTDFTGTLIRGSIGTNSTPVSLGNGGDGLLITGSAGHNTVGGAPYFAARNVIGNNLGNGIHITGSASSNVIQTNFIGSANSNNLGNQVSRNALPNALDGVLVDGSASGNSIGGILGFGELIAGNNGNGVEIAGMAAGTLVQNAFIGIEAFRPIELPNGGDGILITTTGAGTTVEVNPISGNLKNGIEISGNASGVGVFENSIGLDTTGTFPVPNQGDGILVHGTAHGITIGGSSSGSSPVANFIASNAGNGITVADSATGVAIQGNAIGTGVGGLPFGNHGNGVAITTTAGGVSVGGMVPGASNTIANNQQAGVLVSGSSGNPIEGNSIYANSGRGILLVGVGNNNQPAPVLLRLTRRQVLTGRVRGTPGAIIVIEIFDNPTRSNPGFNQGRSLVIRLSVTLGPQGRASFSIPLPVPLARGHFVTATATDLTSNNTSTFSNTLRVR